LAWGSQPLDERGEHGDVFVGPVGDDAVEAVCADVGDRDELGPAGVGDLQDAGRRVVWVHLMAVGRPGPATRLSPRTRRRAVPGAGLPLITRPPKRLSSHRGGKPACQACLPPSYVKGMELVVVGGTPVI
jgi:hypothetical protein